MRFSWKWTYITMACLVIVSGVISFSNINLSTQTIQPLMSRKIVIDAGHGGIDVGAVGVSGTKESEINLSFAQCLESTLQEFGFEVVLTRETQDGLYEEYKNGFKMEDMNNRRQIIEEENPDLFLSLHQNKFSSSSSYGPQVFYKPDDDNSLSLAQNVQNSFDKNLDTKKRAVKVGDFYVLVGNKCPSILIECGFLSNPQEEVLLQSKEYQQKFCNCILQGILTFMV